MIADVVLLHREPVCDPQIEESAMVECHVVENRHGPCTHARNPIRLGLFRPLCPAF